MKLELSINNSLATAFRTYFRVRWVESVPQDQWPFTIQWAPDWLLVRSTPDRWAISITPTVLTIKGPPWAVFQCPLNLTFSAESGTLFATWYWNGQIIERIPARVCSMTKREAFEVVKHYLTIGRELDWKERIPYEVMEKV